MPRYRALNESMKKLRGADYEFRLKGADEINVRHDSVMLEACCTSFQVHYQPDPEDFVAHYNIAQAITAPLLAASANSPMLFGRRLWMETRIPLFQRSIDTRSATSSLRERSARVSFGESWLESSVIELFQEDIARFRVVIGTPEDEDSLDLLNQGLVPHLRALRMHNGTVYRWNRPCYGFVDGKPHLRIENRVVPSGPTLLDEIASGAFFWGLMHGMPEVYDDISKAMTFDDAQLLEQKFGRSEEPE
jgi:hypothetical protein